MSFKCLVLFVEGNDDQIFFEKIVQPLLENKGYHVQTYQYAREKRGKVNAYIKSINAMSTTDYLFWSDYNDRSPCISARIDGLIQTYRGLEREKIRIVIRQIESWYLAGLNDDTCRKLKVPVLRDTNDVTKEMFDRLTPKKFSSRIDFMQELLKHYDLAVAKQKNRSLH